MKPVLAELTEEYASALQEYLEGSEEPALVLAYELGRRALNQDMGLLEVTATHRMALDDVLRRLAGNEAAHVSRAGGFLREALAPFEMALRGYRDAHAALERASEEAEKARADAQRANHAKSEFLSRMSHELRTPLNAVLGFGQLLKLPHSNDEQQEYIRHIVEAGRHLLDLINEVMDISRIEAGHLSLSMEPVRLEETVRASVDLVRPMAHGRGITIETGDGLSCHVRADRQRLKQVLLNLLSNAVKYNLEGGRVTVACRDAGRNSIRLEVGDTGPGIPPEQRKRLFTPFDRMGAEQTAVEGTGLGLALTKGLVELMGGKIGFETEEGRGTTFWVELSASKPVIADLASPDPEGDGPPAEAGGEVADRTVLHIEDSPTNLRLMEQIVSLLPNVRLLSAAQGRLGLEMAREHRPHLILLDLHLPDASGEDILKLLLEDPATRDIPVAVVTADATQRQARRLLAQGARAYITKPFDVPQLLELLGSAQAPVRGNSRGQA